VDKMARHKELCDKLNKMYIEKNACYGDSVSIVRKDLGPISSLTRMYDKWNRMKNLMKNPELDTMADERLTDTMLDLANYLLIEVMERELDKQDELPF